MLRRVDRARDHLPESRGIWFGHVTVSTAGFLQRLETADALATRVIDM